MQVLYWLDKIYILHKRSFWLKHSSGILLWPVTRFNINSVACLVRGYRRFEFSCFIYIITDSAPVTIDSDQDSDDGDILTVAEPKPAAKAEKKAPAKKKAPAAKKGKQKYKEMQFTASYFFMPVVLISIWYLWVWFCQSPHCRCTILSAWLRFNFSLKIIICQSPFYLCSWT